ncbi:hypothetical protein HK097_008868 [Rhizophlyctis rosea]|uniref:Alpha/beta hydrolase fold-3 domain-containing protein n=1 Tax=Rhizophlyctis rosea TaxID=64517 RepID=A0AAD5SCS8_9FUNG|nr:hypothetical protein HK097_008868 [Rhizophlyctis rosea]
MSFLAYFSGLFTNIQESVILSLLRFVASSTSKPPPCPFRTLSTIPSRDPNRSITAHIYAPTTSSAAPLPVLINWHAGGFVLPVHGQDAQFCSLLCETLKIVVIDAEYRKAPENRFPAALNDVEDVISWVCTRPEVYDITKIAFSGFSAGGNLALAASSHIKSFLCPPLSSTQIPHSLITFYPPTNKSVHYTLKSPPSTPIAPTPPFIAALLDKSYPGSEEAKSNPLVSPSLADPTSWNGINMLVFTCDGDVLCKEADELVEGVLKADAEGGSEGRKRKLVLKRLEGVGHAFDKTAKMGSMAAGVRDEAYGMVVDFLREGFGLGVGSEK